MKTRSDRSLALLVATLCITACGLHTSEGGHKEVVKYRLNDPDSAQFRNPYQSTRDKSVWCGEVNARNRLGGMVGYTRYIAYTSRDIGRPELGQVFFDQAAREASNDPTSQSAEFTSKWRVFCT
jgi:hypothetical protein